MIAILTDKPNVGKEIAKVLGANKYEKGYMHGNGYMVTWTFGNMLSLAMPKDYGKKRMEHTDFPLIPEMFRLMVKHTKTENGWIPDIDSVMQLKVIEKVLSECDTIISAMEASREGEMIFRYLYQYLNCNQPVLRLWLLSLTDEAILKGMKNLLPIHMFDNLFFAADVRSKADWVLGLNASYAICKATGIGNNSLGRVQTPVLTAISSRYRERENHISDESHLIRISLCKNHSLIKMRCTKEFKSYETAYQFYQDCKDAVNARIASVKKYTKSIQPPALYNLTELQKDGNRFYNLTAGQVSEIAQSLYEKKLISYPRTANRYITEDIYRTLHQTIKQILEWKEFKSYTNIGQIDTVFLSKRVLGNAHNTEHHAIIATGIHPGILDEKEMAVYMLIVGRMLENFMPDCKVEYTTIEAVCAALKFDMTGYQILENGWFDIFKHESDIATQDTICIELPEIIKGENLSVSACNLIKRRSLPPCPFTDAELIEYMDISGLGTVATRTNIIQTLIDRKYIRYSGKYIIPTRKGLYIYETVRGMKISDSSITSDWEKLLLQIEQGNYSPERFLSNAINLTIDVTEDIFKTYQAKD